MSNNPEVYGATAIVYIDYDKTIEELGSLIKIALELKSIRYDTDEDEPHDLVGYSEVLGFELVLQHKSEGYYEGKYCYSLEINTTDNYSNEKLCGKTYDLSPYYARYISMICKIHTIACVKNGASRQLTKFWHEKSNRMSEEIEM